MATHSSILAWRIPWTEGPGGLQSIRAAKNQTQHAHAHLYEPKLNINFHINFPISYYLFQRDTAIYYEEMFSELSLSRAHTIFVQEKLCACVCSVAQLEFNSL